jgi:hypothetical protein
MKSIIIGLVLMGLVASPIAASAQTVTQEEVNSQLLQIINTLMAQVQELMTKLIAMQAKQVEQGQTLSTIQTQTAPVLGAVQVVPVPVVLTPAQVLEKQFSDKDAVCKSSKVGWVDIFNQSKAWFNDPTRTSLEKEGFYDSYSWIDSNIRTNFVNKQKNESVTPISDYCSWGKFSDSQRSNGCKVALNIQTPYAQCMLSQ